jgi:hypothetical protein
VKAKVELSVDYIHESFWRGYGFNSIEQANRDLFVWLDTVTDVKMELAKVKRELALVRMEREILLKAAAYFVKEWLHGTRRSANSTEDPSVTRLDGNDPLIVCSL